MNATRVLPGIDSPPRIATTLVLAAYIDAALSWRFDLSLALLAYLVFGTVGAVVVVTDFTTRKIPARLVLPAYPLALGPLAVAAAGHGHWWPLERGAVAMVAVCGFYLLLGLTFAGQLGIGDIELGGLLGLYLGWIGWSALVAGTLLGWALAAAAIPVRMVVGGTTTRELPAGPFLVAGVLVAVLAIR